MTLQPADMAIDYNAMADDVFRDEIRSWVAENCPSDLRFPTYRLHHALTRRWYEKLAAKGWLAPSWPRAWGGMELTPTKRVIMSEEFERHAGGGGWRSVGRKMDPEATKRSRTLIGPATKMRN